MMNLFTRTFNTNHRGHKQTKYSLLLVGSEFNSDVAFLTPWRINQGSCNQSFFER